MADATHIFGVIAEFDSSEALLAAAARVHTAGFTHVEAYSPFPVEGLSEALHARASGVAPLALGGGLLGAFTGYFMCWYANVIAYPWNIGGRPHDSWPAWIPITFELMVLFSGLSVGIGMLVLNGLPRHHHPIFHAPNFERASRDRFFLTIEAADPKFHLRETQQFLESLGPKQVSVISEQKETGD